MELLIAKKGERIQSHFIGEQTLTVLRPEVRANVAITALVCLVPSVGMDRVVLALSQAVSATSRAEDLVGHARDLGVLTVASQPLMSYLSAEAAMDITECLAVVQGGSRG